jgi:hypothetical protein
MRRLLFLSPLLVFLPLSGRSVIHFPQRYVDFLPENLLNLLIGKYESTTDIACASCARRCEGNCDNSKYAKEFGSRIIHLFDLTQISCMYMSLMC